MIDIQSVLPHRYPFVMVDQILEIDPGMSARGYKNVSFNEWFITRDNNFMPNMMIVEALAQLGSFAILNGEKGLGFLSSFKGIEFLGNARPGDKLDLYFEIIKNRKGFVLGKGIATIGDSIIVKANELMIYIQAGS